ncbi:calcium/sodium antiporter [Rubricoccus marinus]|uniref:Sodium:calcium antiporter n=1 Tax=Rubricoccus marinus TaxID=716817 RepID=A0A259U4N1_9BACT|nr:calcium/sodium antiporter [Rubricoccus marinus]OZC04784.1 sodium:calcium antiporter [Rubricoccus marinus]
MALHLLTLAGGLALLMVAASGLVRGASALALRFGLSPLIVGLTVVAFGTSAPELVVSVQATLAGAGGIAVGNVVGSNIANVGLILGIAVLVRPIASDRSVLRRDLPALLAATALAAVFLLDRQASAWEGAFLLAALFAYLAWSLTLARREGAAPEIASGARGPAWRDALFVVLGLAGLVVGADLFVGAATALAEAAGVSNAVIGLTVVALGTSLPELATSVVAAWRGEGSIAVGNVIGSNLFNLLGILGVAALVRPIVVPGLQPLDVAVMGAFVLILVPMMLSGRRLVRAEAGVLIAGYAGYMVYLGALHG